MTAAHALANNSTPRAGPRDSPIIMPFDCERAGAVVGVWELENIGGVLVAGKVIDGRKEDVTLNNFINSDLRVWSL